MSAKRSQSAAQLLTVLFTSLVAPLLVNILAQGITNHNPVQGQPEARPTSDKRTTTAGLERGCTESVATRVAAPDTLIRLLADGTGPTPEQAIQNALRNGLARALAAQVDAATWQQRGPALVEQAWRSAERVVRSWREVRVARQANPAGGAHQATIALDLDRKALRECLQ